MSEPPAAADDRPIPFLQRTLENIWFLLALGVILPTVVYTVFKFSGAYLGLLIIAMAVDVAL